MELLKIENATYFYDGTSNGIENIDFSGNEGDFIAVVGKNGAGKSTLLNMLSGLYAPKSGTIKCSPELTYNDLGISAQKQSIDWYLNVYDNIFLGAVLVGMNKKDCAKATDLVAKILDLDSLYKRSPDSLSGGQQQRVQVARALVHNPRIMILDEPTAGLDYHYSQELFEYLKNKTLEGKQLIFVSSHDLSMLEDYCNKILFLDKGKQIYFGDMKTFLNSNNLTKEIYIHFSGNISDELRENLIKEYGVTFDNRIIILVDKKENNLNDIIGKLLKEVSIMGIEKKQISLKDIMKYKEGDNNA